MDRPEESLEERLIPSSSLANENGDGCGMQESDSSATPAVVLSTLVAICGSFAYGCSVCTIIIIMFLVLFSLFLFIYFLSVIFLDGVYLDMLISYTINVNNWNVLEFQLTRYFHA